MATEAMATVAPEAPEFMALLAPVLPKAYAVARALTRNAAHAEDLVQDAALNALRGIHSFRPGSNFKAWFLRILTNAFYMRGREERRGPTVSLEDPGGLFLYGKLQAAEAIESDQAERFLSGLDTDKVLAALHALPPDYRAVATLYFVDDLPYQEIAGILGCPVGTVRSRLHRGRRLLQAALWHVAEDHGLV
jgi:RNA polymerase sigma-70 factor (ECF subfamily)